MIIGADMDFFAARDPDKRALVCGRQELNWRQLAVLVNRLSNWVEQQTRPGSAIALVLPNSFALPLLVMAIARAGRIAQVFDHAWPDAMIQQTAGTVDSGIIISTAGRTPARGMESGRKSICLDETASLDSLSAVTNGFADEYVPQASPAASFYTGFTSGSTGVPKGYRRTHASWVTSFEVEAREFSHTSDDVIIAPGSLSHSLFLYAVVHALHIGATAVMSRTFRPSQVMQQIESFGGTMVYAVPAQLAMFSAAVSRNGASSCSSVRRLIVSGAKWPDGGRVTLKAVFPQAGFAEFYGASELSFVAIARQEDNPPPGSVGRAFAGVDIKILGPAGKPLLANSTGQVFVRSPMVFETYASNETEPDLTRSGDYLSVGDMGYLDDNGFLFLAGRKDRMIVVAGKNLFPEEIEAVFQTHPSINAAAVLPIADSKRGSRIVAMVETAADSRFKADEIIAWARQHLPLYKIPLHYYNIDKWPRTRSGKTDFACLQTLLANGHCELLS